MNAQTFHPFRSEKAQQQYLEFYDKLAETWPVPSDTKMIDTSYGQTFVRISGPDNAPPLVLLPGLNYNSLIWLPNIEALSTNYKTYAIDNIYDYGRSIYSRPLTCADDFTKWLDELFNKLGFKEKINMIGLSFGSWIAAHYLLSHPERLNKVILLAPAGTILPLSSKLLLRGMLSLLPLRYFTKSLFRWLLDDMDKKNETTRIIFENLLQEYFLAKKCFKPKQLIQPTVLSDEQLQSIKVPTLFIIGENEKAYSAQEAIKRIMRIAPHIKTEIILNAGHDLSSSELISKILEFLQS